MLVYIHIPFCDSKCSYCAFNSYVDKFHLKEKYMKALEVQLNKELEKFEAKNNSITSLFIGGGTPSTVSPQMYNDIFEILKPYFCEDIEITTEANPNSATYEWLNGMYKLGVNRVSFGVQSFDDAKLKILNRAHSNKDAIIAINHAKSIGFKNISLDLIYATLGDTKELLENDLKESFKLPINHLSAYALTIEEGTPFESRTHMAQEKLNLTSWLFKKIKEYGFIQYEISNFGSYQSKHNLGYWSYDDYIGLGSGAVGKLKNKRYYPTSDIEEYIKKPLTQEIELLNEQDQVVEKIFLGLRSSLGIKREILNKKELIQIDILIKEKKLYLKNDTFYNYDYLLADEIALFISS